MKPKTNGRQYKQCKEEFLPRIIKTGSKGPNPFWRKLEWTMRTTVHDKAKSSQEILIVDSQRYTQLFVTFIFVQTPIVPTIQDKFGGIPHEWIRLPTFLCRSPWYNIPCCFIGTSTDDLQISPDIHWSTHQHWNCEDNSVPSEESFLYFVLEMFYFSEMLHVYYNS